MSSKHGLVSEIENWEDPEEYSDSDYTLSETDSLTHKEDQGPKRFSELSLLAGLSLLTGLIILAFAHFGLQAFD